MNAESLGNALPQNAIWGDFHLQRNVNVALSRSLQASNRSARMLLRPRRQASMAWLLCAFNFFVTGSYIFAKAVGISLFLSHIDRAALPDMLVVAAVCIAGVNLCTHLFSRYYSFTRLVVPAYCILAGLTLAGSFALRTGSEIPSLLGAIYLLAELRGSLNTVFTVGLTNRFFASTSRPHLYAMVGAGAPTAGILFGVVLSIYAYDGDPIVWLRCAIGLDIAAVLLLLSIRRSRKLFAKVRAVAEATQTDDEAIEEARQKTAPLRRGIGMIIGWKVIVVTMIAIQWQLTVAEHFVADEAKMTAYIGMLYAASDSLVLIAQLLVTGRLIERFGLLPAILSFPVLLAIVGLIAVTAKELIALFVVFTCLRGLDVLRRGLHDTALSLAYAPLPETLRRRTISMVGGVIKPLAECAAAVTALLVISHDFHYVTWIWLVAVGPWIVTTFRVCSRSETAKPPEDESVHIQATQHPQ